MKSLAHINLQSMKKLLFSLLAFTPGIMTMAQNSDNKEPYLKKSFAGQSFTQVESETSGGNIVVRGVNASEARVEVFVWPNNGNKNSLSKDEIDQRIKEDYDLTVSVSNNKLTASAKPKSKNMNWKRALSISFTIYSPKNVSTDLTTSGGNIELSDLSGKQDFTTSGGNLRINNLTGQIKGRTSGGNIYLENSKDNIDVTTSGGNIEANHCTGKINMTTSGGSVKLDDLDGDIDATTSGGNVKGGNIKGDLSGHTSGGNVTFENLYCSVNASTSGGTIRVSINQLGKFVKLNNSSGNIDLEIPKNKGVDLKLSGDRIRTESLSNFDGVTKENKVEGKLNGGGIPVTVDAGSGHVSLSLK
jgi:DUF4097 and DUF4098 domain-containing protein YvlB